MSQICGMIPFINSSHPDQFYRLFISLFIHVGSVISPALVFYGCFVHNFHSVKLAVNVNTGTAEICDALLMYELCEETCEISMV